MDDLSMETNHWVMEDPTWKNYSKHICTREHYWTGYYGSDFFLRTSRTGRFRIGWPNIAEHFYSLQWLTSRWDTIFTSYSLAEIKRFVDKISWPLRSKECHLRIVDEVTKEKIDIRTIL